MTEHGDSVVTIDEVALTSRRNLVAEFTLGHPLPATSEPVYSIRFQGWVVGRHGPVRELTINDGQGKHIGLPVKHRRDDIAQLRPDIPWAAHCGFTARIGAMHLQRDFQLELTALMEDGRRAPIAIVRGRRRALPPLPEPRFTPTLLTTIGRSGSTWLTWLLSRHPDLLAYRTFDLEPKVTAYFSELIRVLSQPTSYVAALQGDIDNGSEWWAGFEPQRGHAWYECDPATDRWLGTEYVESLIPFFASRMDALYAQLAATEGKPGARRFIEKIPPTSFVQRLWSELYPGMREIFLVRDPRDVACSIFALQRKHGAFWFWRSRARTDEEVIRQPISDGVHLLSHCWAQRSETAHLLRYEDLISEPRGTLARVFEFLDLDASAATLDQVLADGFALDDGRRTNHGTSGDPSRSVERWREDLSPDLQQVCEEAFAPAMAAFGYS